MLSRLSQGVSSVLQELSGEEGSEADSQVSIDVLIKISSWCDDEMKCNLKDFHDKKFETNWNKHNQTKRVQARFYVMNFVIDTGWFGPSTPAWYRSLPGGPWTSRRGLGKAGPDRTAGDSAKRVEPRERHPACQHWETAQGEDLQVKKILGETH